MLLWYELPGNEKHMWISRSLTCGLACGHEACAVNTPEETSEERNATLYCLMHRVCVVLEHAVGHGWRAGVPCISTEAPHAGRAVFDNLTHRGKHVGVLGSESRRLGNLSVWEKEAT